MSDTPADAGLRRRLTGALGAQGVLLVLISVQEIILLPFYLQAWGLPIYRDWLVMITATEFLSRLDFGLQNYFSNAFMRRFTRAELGPYRRLRALAWTIYVALIGIGVAILAAVLGGMFGPLADSDHVSHTAIALLGMTVLLRLPLGFLQGIYRAHREPARALTIEALATLLRIGLIVAALSLGGGPTSLAALIAALWLLILIGIPFDQWRRYREAPFRICRPRAQELRDSFGTGFVYNLQSWGMTLTTQGLLLAVARWAPDAAAVVLLSAARTLSGLVRQIALQMASIMGVEQSREHAADRHDRLLRLHHINLRLGGTISGLMAALVAILGAQILSVWSNGKLAFDPWLFAFLLSAALISLPARASSQLAMYTNRPRSLAIANLGQGAMLIVLTAWLAPIMSARGAALALLITEVVIIAGWLGRHHARDFGESWGAQWSYGWRWALTALAGGALLTYGVDQSFAALGVSGETLAGLTARLAAWALLALPLVIVIGLPKPLRSALWQQFRKSPD